MTEKIEQYGEGPEDHIQKSFDMNSVIGYHSFRDNIKEMLTDKRISVDTLIQKLYEVMEKK